MRAPLIVLVVICVAGLAFFIGRRSAPRAKRAAQRTELHCPEPVVCPPAQAPASAPVGTPLRSCLEQVARLDRNLKAAARCAPDGGAAMSDNQARALMALMAEHDRARLEAIVEAEIRGRRESEDSARRTQAETMGAALADHVGLVGGEYDRVKQVVCPLRAAQERLRSQLTRSEILPEEYFALLTAQRGETEKALETLLGGERYAKLRAAGGLGTFPCE